MKKPAHKARTVGKPHQHAKPAGHHAAAHQHQQHAHKHVTAKKHHTQAKKHKGAHHQAKKRRLSRVAGEGRSPVATRHEGFDSRGLLVPPAAGLLDSLACCAAVALAASLRLQGHPVGDADVLGLFRAAGGDPEAGASILAVLEAATRHGLADGATLKSFHPVQLPDLGFPGQVEGNLILGLELPGPHAVLATPEGWWSWGELRCPCQWPDAVIEEAWAVTWA